MIFIYGLLSVLLLQQPSVQTETGELREAVESYWHLLQRGDKSRAAAFVAPQTRPHFLARQEPLFRSWRLDQMDVEGAAASVTVVVKRLIQDGFYDWKVREDWVLGQDGWQVLVTDQGAARKKFWAMRTTVRPQEGLLDLRPVSLRLHFFSGSQRATVWVRNGLAQAVHVVGLEYDRERFEIEESPDSIQALSAGAITLRYRGDETAKELHSELIVKLKKTDEQATHFTVPITYNVVSRAARSLLGVNRAQAAGLNKGDKVTVRRLPPPERR